jgi:hypothetical protein
MHVYTGLPGRLSTGGAGRALGRLASCLSDGRLVVRAGACRRVLNPWQPHRLGDGSGQRASLAAGGTGLAPRRSVTARAPRAAPPAETTSQLQPWGWQWRLPLLLWLGWTGWHYLADPAYWSIFSGIIFGSHEFGHLFFAFAGEFMTVAGGSLMQLLVPIGAIALLIAWRDYFGASCAGCWLSFSLSNLAVYVGDAVAQELPLVSFSPDGGEHDWFYLLDHFGALGYDLRIAMMVRRVSALILAASFFWGAWSCLRMNSVKSEK